MPDAFEAMKNLTEGWNAIDGIDDQAAEINRQNALQQFNAAIEIARPFMSTEGQIALAALRRVTIEMPAWVPGQDASYGYAREGQDSMIRYIEDCIALAKRGPPMVANDDPTTTSIPTAPEPRR